MFWHSSMYFDICTYSIFSHISLSAKSSLLLKRQTYYYHYCPLMIGLANHTSYVDYLPSGNGQLCLITREYMLRNNGHIYKYQYNMNININTTAKLSYFIYRIMQSAWRLIVGFTTQKYYRRPQYFQSHWQYSLANCRVFVGSYVSNINHQQTMQPSTAISAMNHCSPPRLTHYSLLVTSSQQTGINPLQPTIHFKLQTILFAGFLGAPTKGIPSDSMLFIVGKESMAAFNQ